MVVQAACELGLVQVGGNVLIWHLLLPSLNEILFLSRLLVCAMPLNRKALKTYLAVAPGAATSVGGIPPVLRRTILVAFPDVACGRVHAHNGAHVCCRHVDDKKQGIKRLLSRSAKVTIVNFCR